MSESPKVFNVGNVNHIPCEFIQFTVSYRLRSVSVFKCSDLESLLGVKRKIATLKGI